MSDILFIMNYAGEKVGQIERTAAEFIQELHGDITKYQTLPPILNDIAPAMSQFPAVNDILDYYHMDKMDVWTYMHRSNGIKGSREHWFMSEPVGEVWLPFFLSDRYRSFGSKLREGADVKVTMSAEVYALNRTLDIIPRVVKDYLVREGETRFSTATGTVYDLAPYPAQKGLIGRLIINFPVKE